MAAPTLRQLDSPFQKISLIQRSRTDSKAGSMPLAGPLIDSFGRVHKSLRVSLTDRCNLRCTYCMPEEAAFLSGEHLLTSRQIVEVVEVGVALGLDKIRLTGGEPLLRRDLMDIVIQLGQIKGIRDLSLTTNGILLKDLARPLLLAGLSRLTISLDTLIENTFSRLSRRQGLDRVLEGIAAAKEAGFQGTKLNAVILKGINETEIIPLAAFARENNLTLRFIESMPIGADPWDRQAMVSGLEIKKILEDMWGPLIPEPDQNPHAPAMDFHFADRLGRIGLIMSVTRPFCGQCDRLRLTADGKLRNCLFSLQETDLRDCLGSSSDGNELKLRFRQSVWEKWEGHEINSARFLKPERTMHAIGG